MSHVIEKDTGAQLLPRVNDERAHLTSWAARICCDADWRTQNTFYRDLSARLEVHPR